MSGDTIAEALPDRKPHEPSDLLRPKPRLDLDVRSVGRILSKADVDEGESRASRRLVENEGAQRSGACKDQCSVDYCVLKLALCTGGLRHER